EAGVVKVADFGLVRGGDLTTSLDGRVVGTPHYMSPEQCRGERADARSDLYALGATYFHLLTGRTPYPDHNPVQLMFAHCDRPAPDPRAYAAGVPDGCTAVVRRAMAKAPTDRYQTAGGMLADLLALLSPARPPETGTGSGPPDGASAAAGRFCKPV